MILVEVMHVSSYCFLAPKRSKNNCSNNYSSWHFSLNRNIFLHWSNFLTGNFSVKPIAKHYFSSCFVQTTSIVPLLYAVFFSCCATYIFLQNRSSKVSWYRFRLEIESLVDISILRRKIKLWYYLIMKRKLNRAIIMIENVLFWYFINKGNYLVCYPLDVEPVHSCT